MKKCKIKSIKPLGIRRTYNLTMESEQHNYALFDRNTNGNLITRNSHSACYGYNSYTTAYLKANYPDEFICSLLNVSIHSASGGDKYEKVEAFEKEFQKKMNIKILPRDVNKSKSSYTIERRKDDNIVDKTEIRPSLLCKGLGEAAAIEIEKSQPYTCMSDLVEKTNVSVGVVEALAIGGYIRFIKKIKGEEEESYVKRVVDDFRTIREDRKKLSLKKMESFDIFAGNF